LTGNIAPTQGDSMDDKEALEYYRDPENQVPAGEGHQRQGRRLSSTVPVRFSQDMLTAVRRFATQDGINVSTWIRRLVAKEIERRQPPATATASSQLPIHLEGHPDTTTASAAPLELVLC
jgi:predicted DNA binding CopG/RHH family protein